MLTPAATAKKLKTGTRIEVLGLGQDFRPVWHGAKIGRWHSSFRRIEKPTGYHPVAYDDGGGELLVHESSFRVVDNRQ